LPAALRALAAAGLVGLGVSGLCKRRLQARGWGSGRTGQLLELLDGAPVGLGGRLFAASQALLEIGLMDLHCGAFFDRWLAVMIVVAGTIVIAALACGHVAFLSRRTEGIGVPTGVRTCWVKYGISFRPRSDIYVV